jgi:hypothetical protein
MSQFGASAVITFRSRIAARLLIVGHAACTCETLCFVRAFFHDVLAQVTCIFELVSAQSTNIATHFYVFIGI